MIVIPYRKVVPLTTFFLVDDSPICAIMSIQDCLLDFCVMPQRDLLSREDFRALVFARDGHTCVFCDQPAVDAHHILERRLWSDGGYYLDNGASVCTEHHLQCEMTTLSVEAVRQACGINKPIIPDHLYDDSIYDKWGNIILANGTRLRGELFFDPFVQKILAQGGVLNLFTNRVKYPRTHHLPWSEGMHDDDRMHTSMDGFVGQRVIVTEKRDGENSTMYADYLHARSVDGRHHSSRDWVKNFWSKIAADIPQDWRICGENLYAQHSIQYDLSSYFEGFSIWNDQNICLSWDDTLDWFRLLDITPVPMLYDGIYDEAVIRALYHPAHWAVSEGYVLRLADAFAYGRFRHAVGKFVRVGHVQTTKHWMYGQKIVPNRLV